MQTETPAADSAHWRYQLGLLIEGAAFVQVMGAAPYRVDFATGQDAVAFAQALAPVPMGEGVWYPNGTVYYVAATGRVIKRGFQVKRGGRVTWGKSLYADLRIDACGLL